MSAKPYDPMDAVICGKVRNWHRPANPDCPHNSDIKSDCNCKRIVNRKPFRVVRVHDDNVPYRVNPNLILEIYPHGRIAIREQRRSRRYWTSTADIYAWRVRIEALQALAAAKKARAEKRKQKQQQRKGVSK